MQRNGKSIHCQDKRELMRSDTSPEIFFQTTKDAVNVVTVFMGTPTNIYIGELDYNNLESFKGMDHLHRYRNVTLQMDKIEIMYKMDDKRVYVVGKKGSNGVATRIWTKGSKRTNYQTVMLPEYTNGYLRVVENRKHIDRDDLFYFNGKDYSVFTLSNPTLTIKVSSMEKSVELPLKVRLHAMYAGNKNSQADLDLNVETNLYRIGDHKMSSIRQSVYTGTTSALPIF